MAKPKTKIAAAVGTATSGEATGDLHYSAIQAAMDEAAQKCFDDGIQDPDKVREAKLAARERVKAEFAEDQARAAKAAAKE
jgi:hypothetical protein